MNALRRGDAQTSRVAHLGLDAVDKEIKFSRELVRGGIEWVPLAGPVLANKGLITRHRAIPRNCPFFNIGCKFTAEKTELPINIRVGTIVQESAYSARRPTVVNGWQGRGTLLLASKCSVIPMEKAQSPAPDARRANALAVERDFRALVELVSRYDDGMIVARELTSVKASVERGLRLAEQLLGRIDGEASQ